MPRTGRIRTTGNGPKPNVYQRVAVSYHFKLRALRYLDRHTMEESITRFYPGIERSQVRSKKRICYTWKASRALIEAKCAAGLGSHQHHRARGMGATLAAVAEVQLVRWATDLRADGVPVRGLMLKLQARYSYAATGLPRGAFTASWSWRKHFQRRHKLSIRRKTREGQTSPHDASEQLADFSRQVQEKMKELKITKVYNVDQTGVDYEYVPTGNRQQQWCQDVWVKCAGKSKDRVTAMPLADSHGNKADPFLVFKTRPSKVAERARENTIFRHGFGRTNSIPSSRRENMHEPVLLLWDDFSGHWRQDVLICARLLNVELMEVPPGYTYVRQPADAAWNRPLKEHLRNQWVQFLLAQVCASSRESPFKMTAPSRPDVIAWIKSAWTSLTTATIIGGFKKAKLVEEQTQEEEEAMPEPNWGALILLLQQERVPMQAINLRNDIEEDGEVYEETVE